MSLDEIELTALRDLSEVEFLHVAHGIAQNSDMMLCHSDLMAENFDQLIDCDGESFFVSRNLTAVAAFEYAVLISNANNHPPGEFFTEKTFCDHRKAAANDR